MAEVAPRANVATAPINSIPAVQVTAPASPWPMVMPIPVVTGNVPMPSQAPVAPQAVVVMVAGTAYAQIAPIPMIMLTAGTATSPAEPIPVVVVG